MWDALDRQTWIKPLLDALLGTVPTAKGQSGPLRNRKQLQRDGNARYLFDYNDGTHGGVAMLGGLARGIGAGVHMSDGAILATDFEMRDRPFPHFAYLTKAIEQLVHTGHSPYPVERTVLTTGLLDACMTSLGQGGRKIATDHLAIHYDPVVYPFAPKPKLY